jgi:CheY-like chemotaxis protein
LKFLIVDDDQAVLNALDASLTGFGYRVVTAKDGFKAIETIKSSGSRDEPVMFLITDMKMPGINGIELIRSARKLIPGLKAILITAYGDKNVRKDIKNLEGCGYLEKPFEPEKLNKLIMKLKACKGG